MPRPARPWFRLYSEMLYNRKVQRLKPALFKHWINFLCIANNGNPRGSLPPIPDIAFALRPMTEGQAFTVVQELTALGLIDTDGDVLVMHDWSGGDEGWQYDSDAENYIDPGEAGRRSNHARWHVKRGILSPDCPYCIQGSSKDESLGLSDRVTREETETDTEEETEKEADPETEGEQKRSAHPPSKKSLNDADIAAVQEKFPNVDVTELAEDFRDYVAQHPRKYTDYPRALLSWARKENRNGGTNTRGTGQAIAEFPRPGGLGRSNGNHAEERGGGESSSRPSPFSFLNAR